MPKKHQIASLEELALRSVGQFVTDVGRHIMQPICIMSSTDPAHGIATLNSWLEWIKLQLVSNVPWYLYDRMSVEVLKSILNLITKIKNSCNQYYRITSYLSELNVVVNLTEVVIHSNLKTIEFSVWPKIMRHIFYKNLHVMTGLEILDLGSGSAGWKTSGIEKMIIQGVSAMPNLTSFTLCFDCTNSIVTAVGQNCPKLQKLDVTASRSVTDRCLTILQKCWQLREIQLFRTSVSRAGYAELLLEHPNLENIGRCDEFGYILEYIRNTSTYKKPFNLKIFESRDVTTEHLHLLVEMCPNLTKVSIVLDESINDLLILSRLNNLTELKLLCGDFFTDRMKELLETRGAKITSLHLEHVNEIDLNALIYISQFCPMLKHLVLYNCEFDEHAAIVSAKLFVPPFKYLERIKCVADCAHLHLEFLLSHCVNIKFIQLGSSTGIGDDTMARVLSKNPMNKLEELKILYSDDLSMKTVRLLMQNCDNLRRLSELESWQGISLAELNVFQSELRINNIDLDISPTLSLA
ncbi:F-box/LRR-repeat protein 7-like [Neodiprion pinetum]|uniref:uncharacterized protein LOC124176555 n=1 Tax=Neodiprion fabricii TaxID=2872261 RepID=UPI001ED9150D|nr:uncharacterized protein LOC124176555 [Neodiprion fabricii]XP_046467088.1 uncharacterized protein LOC124211750 [Neodiprion pinetum]XP_046607350.1 uncharacterized protein LOC124298850 [Neodiprion virginianus]